MAAGWRVRQRQSDERRISVNHLLDVRLDSAIFVLEVVCGVFVNDVGDECVDCRLFRLGAVAGIHETYCDAVLVVGFFGALVLLVVFVEEHHVGECGGLDVARELVHVVDRVAEPQAFAVVIATVDGVRRLVGAAVTHFNAESELVPLVCDVVKDGGALFLAANGVVPFFDLACLGDCDLHGCPLSCLRGSRILCFLPALIVSLSGAVGARRFSALCGGALYVNDGHTWYDGPVGSPGRRAGGNGRKRQMSLVNAQWNGEGFVLSEDELVRLLESDMRLNALGRGGVDNWEWYGDSCCDYLDAVGFDDFEDAARDAVAQLKGGAAAE